MLIGVLIPVSDSGKAVQTLPFERHPYSFDRGFAPCLMRENHLQESRAFWLLFCGKKVTRLIRRKIFQSRRKFLKKNLFCG